MKGHPSLKLFRSLVNAVFHCYPASPLILPSFLFSFLSFPFLTSFYPPTPLSLFLSLSLLILLVFVSWWLTKGKSNLLNCRLPPYYIYICIYIYSGGSSGSGGGSEARASLFVSGRLPVCVLGSLLCLLYAVKFLFPVAYPFALS